MIISPLLPQSALCFVSASCDRRTPVERQLYEALHTGDTNFLDLFEGKGLMRGGGSSRVLEPNSGRDAVVPASRRGSRGVTSCSFGGEARTSHDEVWYL